MGDYTERMFLRHLDYDHLYRHLTEVNGKDTRGGYIEGKLELDPVLLSCQEVLGLKIYIVSDEKALVRDRIHPNLLYMTRFEGKVRKRELESSTPLWKIELEIRDGVVYWWTESEAQLAGYKQRVCLLHPNPYDPSVHNILDLKDLHLTVITPLQRTTANGIKIKDALNLRRHMARFEDWEDHDWEKLVKELESYYTKNGGKSELDRVCLRFTLHLVEGEDKEDPNPCSELISMQPITNTRSRHLGALNLIPDTMISAQKTCCRVQRTIYLPSQFKLPLNAKDVYPRFVVGHPDQGDYSLDDRVKQPKDTDIRIFGQFWVFTTPLQSDQLIQQVYNEGQKIYLEAYRPKDRTVSDKKIEFVFAIHEEYEINDGTNIVLCSSCLEHPDHIGQGETLVNSLKKLQTSGHAKPGTKRRRTRVMSSISEVSNSSGFVSPGRSAFSPSYTHSPESNVSEDLMKEIDGMDEDIQIDNIDPSSFGNDIDINRLLETFGENDIEPVDSSNMRPSIYPDLLSSAVRQNGINGMNDLDDGMNGQDQMNHSIHDLGMESATYLGAYTELQSATSRSRMLMMPSAPMSRPPSVSAPMGRPPSSLSPMSMPPSSTAATTKRISRPLARISDPAPSSPRLETQVKVEPPEVNKVTENYSMSGSGRSLMFPMGRVQRVLNQRNIDDLSSDDTDQESADIRVRSVVKNDVMLSLGAKVESVSNNISIMARRIVKLEGTDTEDDDNSEDDFCTSIVKNMKEEDLDEKFRPSVLELAERFGGREERIIKSEEVCDVVEVLAVQDVVDDNVVQESEAITPVSNEDIPVLAPSLGSPDNTENLDVLRGRISKYAQDLEQSKSKTLASVPSTVYSWLGDLFPALLYLLTPFLVLFVAILVQLLWTTFAPNVKPKFPEEQNIEDLTLAEE